MQIRCPYTEESVIVNMDYESQSKNKINKNQKMEITLNGNVKLKLKIPTMMDLINTKTNYETDKDLINLIPTCLMEIESEANTVDLSMETDEKKLEVLESLNIQDYKKIKSMVSKGFFRLKLNYVTSDGTVREVVVSDFVNFLKFFLVTLT